MTTLGEWAAGVNTGTLDDRQRKMVFLLRLAMTAMESKEHPPTYDYYAGAVMVLNLVEFLVADKKSKPPGHVLTESEFSEWMVYVAKAVSMAVLDLSRTEAVQ